MDLIIALILLAIYAVRKGDEKAQIKGNARMWEVEWKRKTERKKAFTHKYCAGEELYWECKEEYDKRGEDYQRVYDQILAETGVQPPPKMVFLSLIGERGKIPAIYLQEGINNRSVSYNIHPKVRTQIFAEMNKLMQWYDDLLQKNGMEEPLVFVPTQNNNKIEIWDIYSMGEEKCRRRGCYCWAPMKTMCVLDGKPLY